MFVCAFWTHRSLRSRIWERICLNFNQAALRVKNFTSMHCTPSPLSFNKSYFLNEILMWDDLRQLPWTLTWLLCAQRTLPACIAALWLTSPTLIGDYLLRGQFSREITSVLFHNYGARMHVKFWLPLNSINHHCKYKVIWNKLHRQKVVGGR